MKPEDRAGEASPPAGTRPASARDYSTHDTSGPAGASPRQAPDLEQQARDVVDDVKREANDIASQAKESAHAAASKQKDAAAERVDGFAHALQAASDDLRGRGQETAAAYVRDAAGGLERVTHVLRERDIDELLGSVEDFARRQPVAFFGGAVAVGFGLARVMKSSAERRHQPETRPAPGSGFGEGGIR